MKKLLALLLGLALSWSSADATNFVIKNTGTGGATFKTVMDSINAGQTSGAVVVNINNGTYDYTGPFPTVSGTASNRITFIGNLASPQSVKVVCGGYDSYNEPTQRLVRDYITIKGVRFDQPNAASSLRRSLSIGATQGWRPTYTMYDSIISCQNPYGLGMIHCENIIFKDCTFGEGNKQANIYLRGFDPEDKQVRNSKFLNCSFYLRVPARGHQGSAAWEWQGAHCAGEVESGITGVEVSDSDILMVRENDAALDCNANEATAGGHGRWLKGTFGCNFLRNRWTYTDSSGCNTSLGAESFKVTELRDKSENNVFDSDTLLIDSNAAGFVNISASGSCSGVVGHNAFRRLLWINLGRNPVPFKWQDGCNSDSVVNSVILSDSTKGYALSVDGTRTGTTVIDHSLIYSKKNQQGSLVINNQSGYSTAGVLQISNSILAVGAATGVTSAAFSLARQPQFTINMFNNVFWNEAGVNQSIRHSYNGGGTGYYSPSGFCTNFGTGCSSYTGDPLWTTSTISTAFNPTPLTNSSVLDRGTLGTDIGPVEVTTDSIRPAAINSLAFAEKGADYIRFEWVAVGDDSLTSTANHYIFRYSATEITSGNFDTANQLPNTLVGNPASPGSVQGFTLGGLSPNNYYWFAVKTVDDVNLTSAISNILVVRTGAGGGGTAVIDP